MVRVVMVMMVVVVMVMIKVVESPTWSLQPSCFSSSSAPLLLENCNIT